MTDNERTTGAESPVFSRAYFTQQRAVATPTCKVGGSGKRVFDVLASGVAIIALLPVFLLIALAVRITSNGPILFWSDRVGIGASIFRMPKFRTMKIASPLVSREALADADQYLTPIGTFLRKTSLDELPQLFSVLLGQMSLVGPRPLIFQDLATQERLKRPDVFTARPGMTGLAQVSGRNYLSARNKVRYDFFYASRWSWRLEFMIALRTIACVLGGRGIL